MSGSVAGLRCAVLLCCCAPYSTIGSRPGDKGGHWLVNAVAAIRIATSSKGSTPSVVSLSIQGGGVGRLRLRVRRRTGCHQTVSRLCCMDRVQSACSLQRALAFGAIPVRSSGRGVLWSSFLVLPDWMGAADRPANGQRIAGWRPTPPSC